MLYLVRCLNTVGLIIIAVCFVYFLIGSTCFSTYWSTDRIISMLSNRISFLLGVFVVIIFYLKYTFTFWSRQGLPNETKSFYNRLLEPLHKADMASVARYGKVVGLYEGFRPSLLVADEKLVMEVLQNRFWTFANHRKFYQKGQLGSKKLVVLEGQEWKSMRAIISPLFTAKNVRMMKSGIDHSVQRLLGNLNETLQRTRPGEPALVDVRQVCTAFALEVVAETVFGVRVDSLHTPNDPIVKNLRKLFGVNVGLRALVYIYCPWLARLLNLYLLDHHVLLYLHDFTKKLMNARLNERTRSPSSSATSSCSSAEQPVMTNPASAHLLSESRATNNTAGESANANLATGPTNPPKRRRLTPRAQENFITWLLDAEYQDSNGEIRRLTEEEIIDNSMLFIVAGVDTTASTLSIIMYCLACHPHVQEKLYTELNSFRCELQAREGEKGTEAFCYDTDTLNRMEYLSACIWEAMRYIPTVPRIDRRSTEDCYLQVNGRQVFVPRNTIITIPTYAVYRNSNLFERADHFWPERFMRSNQPANDKYEQSTCRVQSAHSSSIKRRVSPGSMDFSSAHPPAYRGVYFPFAMGIRDCIGKTFAMLELKTVIAHVILNYKLKAAPETKKDLEFFQGQPILNAKDIRVHFMRRPTSD